MALSEAIGAMRMHSELLFAPSLMTPDMDKSKSTCQTIDGFSCLTLAAMNSHEFSLLSLQPHWLPVNRISANQSFFCDSKTPKEIVLFASILISLMK